MGVAGGDGGSGNRVALGGGGGERVDLLVVKLDVLGQHVLRLFDDREPYFGEGFRR